MPGEGPRSVTGIIGFDDDLALDPQWVGGKGANLARLSRAGLPVPPGFIVSADACRQVLATLGQADPLPAQIAAEEVDALCATRREALLGAALPAALQQGIDSAWQALVARCGPTLRVAVRSSATAEDGEGASFAGQYETYYDVDAAQLLDRLRACWASLWTPRALRYRLAHGLYEPLAMAVVVQQMVPAEVSGVAFTIDPVSGAEEIVVEATWGLGAALVDGRVSPDRFRVGREDLALRHSEIGAKQWRAGSDGGLIAGDLDAGRGLCLDEESLAAVGRLALRCEGLFGAAQDVEWALADDAVAILQSRPVTTVVAAEEVVLPAGRFVLAKPLVENFTDPISPLLADLLEAAVGPSLRVVYGRIYADIGSYRRLLPWSLSDAELAQYLYSMFAVLPQRRRLSLPGVLRLSAALLLVGLLAGPLLLRTRNMPDDFMDGFAARCRRVAAAPDVDALGLLTELAMRPRLTQPVGWHPIAVNITAIRAAFWLGCLRRLLQRWVPQLSQDLAVQLTQGTAGVRSAELGEAVEALAAIARPLPAVQAILDQAQTGTAAMVALEAEPEAQAFVAGLQRLLAEHGHRALRELDIVAARWHEDPLPLLQMIRNQITVTAQGRRQGGLASRQQAEAMIRAALGREGSWLTTLRWRLIDGIARRCRYFFKLRENSRCAHIRIFDTLREHLRGRAEALVQAGCLRQWQDVFLLHMGELEALGEGRLAPAAAETRIRARRARQRRWAGMTPPRTLGIDLGPELELSAAVDDRGLLHGLPASPGVCRGRARVILDPAVDARLLPGEILVAPFTDPAWTPLFLTAGAAVVEVGSFLSHAGTVAREYGMPCVVDVDAATRRIRSGEWIEVDGQAGTVRRLQEANAPEKLMEVGG